jgi:hypothetical protein
MKGVMKNQTILLSWSTIEDNGQVSLNPFSILKIA